ncbi:MAG: ribulose-phosphate 3-epimerase [Armatimonadetes bacterium]|nr:ribulose-phosphate 3-epimerase [Armatimonadota bacterium]
MLKISASILSADFSSLKDEIKKLEKTKKIDLIHFDLMDGHFVPNLTFGPLIIKSLRDKTNLPFEAHLMLEGPEHYFQALKEARVETVIIQIETVLHLKRVFNLMKSYNFKVGAALNPSTPISFLEYILEDLDLILIMTVDPGFPAQEFIKSMLIKIEKVKNLIKQSKKKILIEIDGGINYKTAPLAVEKGAEILVIGSNILNSGNYKKAVQKILKNIDA